MGQLGDNWGTIGGQLEDNWGNGTIGDNWGQLGGQLGENYSVGIQMPASIRTDGGIHPGTERMAASVWVAAGPDGPRHPLHRTGHGTDGGIHPGTERMAASVGGRPDGCRHPFGGRTDGGIHPVTDRRMPPSVP